MLELRLNIKYQREIKKNSDERPFFSIIIPTYNVEAFLASALGSILAQGYPDYEIIIMDGLSKDNTVAIANDYARKDNRIKVYSEKDRGIYDAMNKGVKLSKGKWLYFMGSDDTFFDEAVLEKISKEVKNSDLDVVYGSVSSEKYGSRYDGMFNYEKLTQKNICHQALFLNKRMFDSIGNFNLKYKALADWDHNIRWFFSSKIKYRYIDIIIANYAKGGFSDQYDDLDFNSNKEKIFLKNGYNKLRLNKLIDLCNKLYNKSKLANNYIDYIFFRIIYLALKIIKKIKHFKLIKK